MIPYIGHQVMWPFLKSQIIIIYNIYVNCGDTGEQNTKLGQDSSRNLFNLKSYIYVCLDRMYL